MLRYTRLKKPCQTIKKIIFPIFSADKKVRNDKIYP